MHKLILGSNAEKDGLADCRLSESSGPFVVGLGQNEGYPTSTNP
jgi:hypothetical protein